MIETFFVKIASAVFKKALLSSAPKSLASTYEINSVFDRLKDILDCLESINDCNDLGVCALRVFSDPLSEAAVDSLLELKSQTFTVEKTSSGIYIASQIIPSFSVAPSRFPSEVFAE